ncbi:MAG: inverse autotransporter beta domain-containing protein [Phormidesmis sp.]
MRYQSLAFALGVSGSLTGICLATAIAQPTESSPESSPEPSTEQPTETTAADLQISPRFGIDLNTPRNGDNDRSFSQISAFFPVFQTPNRHLTFFNTSGRVDTDGNLGGNVSVGHRFAVSNGTIIGGYAAYDLHNTGQNTFNQIGLGAEAIGQNWTAHLNGYIPIGDTSAATGSATGNGSVVDAQFQNNQLLLTTGGLQLVETALSSAEAGMSLKLGDFGNYGDLWGASSVYYLSDSLGGSAQLEHRLGDRFRLAIGAQSDGVFGTQVFASIGTSFGGAHKVSAPDSAPDSAQSRSWAERVAAPIARNNRILVQSETQGTDSETLVAINPETRQAYDFRHVTPDAANANAGDGSANSPFTTLGTGMADTANTGLRDIEAGEIVYVRAGDSQSNAIAPFTIPAGVQVYSEAIATTLPTQLGNILLPSSGTGIRPRVNADGNDGITLTGGNNRVSGFEIENSNNGIQLDNPSGRVSIENNLIRSASNRALFLDQSAGEADIIITNNTIDTAIQDGIRVELTNSANLSLAITNNAIQSISDRNGDGIDIEVNDDAIAALNITNNQIDRAGNSGIELETCGNTTTTACNASFTAAVTGNTVTRSGGDGILFFHNSDQPAQLTIANNQVQQSGVNRTGVTLNADNPLPVPGNGGFGIMAAAFADGDLNITIENNTVTDSQDEKIAIINTLESNTASAATSAAPTVNASIQNNTLSGTGAGLIAGNDISVISGATSGSLSLPAVCLKLQSNATNGGYFLANGLTGTTNPPSVPAPIATPGTFSQTAGNTTDNLIATGTLTFPTAPLSALGPLSVSSAGDTTSLCTLP